MSKAFTKEGDGTDDEEPDAPEPLPAGVKNYITPAGLARLQDELRRLRTVERPKVVETVSWAAGNGDRSENGDYIFGKRKLREIDRRMRHLSKRLEIAVPVDPAQQAGRDRVLFGAVVTYAEEDGTEHTVRIVGIDEARLDEGEISWISPVARALLRASEGDMVDVHTPAGPKSLEVVRIDYPDA